MTDREADLLLLEKSLEAMRESKLKEPRNAKIKVSKDDAKEFSDYFEKKGQHQSAEYFGRLITQRGK